MGLGLNQARLKAKIKAVFDPYNDTDLTQLQIEAARVDMADKLAQAIIEEIQFAKLSVPGLGLTASGVGVLGTSITGTLT